jgi:hypothetical protein
MLALSYVHQVQPMAVSLSGQCENSVRLETRKVLDVQDYRVELEQSYGNVYRNAFPGIDDPRANPLLERLLGF